MQDLVIRTPQGKDVTTSLRVAEIFGKEHKNVLRDIESLTCSVGFRQLNFELSVYISLQTKELPMYLMTKDGFSFLVMGYRGKKASQFKEMFIGEFNKRGEIINSLNGSPELEARIRKIEARFAHQEVTEFTIFGYASYCSIRVCSGEAMTLGKQAAKMCREQGLPVGKTKDTRYGMINTYPESVLYAVFSEFVKKPRF